MSPTFCLLLINVKIFAGVFAFLTSLLIDPTIKK